MITVAVANVLESSEKALQFIYQTSKNRGLKVESISPQTSTVYKKNKRIPLKHYMEQLSQTKKLDLLIVELTKEALERQIYEHVDFNIVVLFDGKTGEKRNFLNRGCITHTMLNHFKSNYYILPSRYKDKVHSSITYGWSKEADVSASSAESMADGKLQMQCCIHQSLPSLNGKMNILKEFGIQSNVNDIDGLLAGIATMIIYGIELD